MFLGGLFLGATTVGWWALARVARLSERLRLQQAELELQRATHEENQRLRVAAARLAAEREADAERMAWIHSAESELRTAFQAMASQTLQQSLQLLGERSQEQFAGMVRAAQTDFQGQQNEFRQVVEPLAKTLDLLGSQVRQLEKERVGAYQGLQREVELLREAHRALNDSAVGLQQALRAPTVRGRWGEVQLRRVVEMAGLVQHVDFLEQPVAAGLRPDLVIHLPQQGRLAIDAKAPMEAFLAASAVSDGPHRQAHLAAHRRSLRQRIQELGQRGYWQQFAGSPDFVVMFVPSDACLACAFEQDPDLFDFALRCHVLLATPVTLLALLKAVALVWRQQQVTDHARAIAACGRELHERLGGFVEHLRRLGKHLDQAVGGYQQAVGALERRVMPAIRRLEEVGVADRRLADLGALAVRAVDEDEGLALQDELPSGARPALD